LDSYYSLLVEGLEVVEDLTTDIYNQIIVYSWVQSSLYEPFL